MKPVDEDDNVLWGECRFVGNFFFDFLRLQIFKIIPKDFGGSQKIRENIFQFKKNPGKFLRACEKFPKIFFGKIRTRAHPPTRIISNHSKTGQNPQKPPILRGDRNNGQ